MLFNSYPFLFAYLPVVFIVFFGLAKSRVPQFAQIWLLLSSLFFYGYWNPHFLPLFAGSILFNYAIGAKILSSFQLSKKRVFLFIGLLGDLTLLFYYKYAAFFLKNVFDLMPSFAETAFDNILPLGISFFTFTQIAYLADAYQGKAEKSGMVSYGLFVSVFPHLIAGPILHHREMLKQFSNPCLYAIIPKNVVQGALLFILGLFKKVVLADSLATFVKPVFDAGPEAISFVPAWFGTLAYTLQLYLDFSGYSDMAIGLGLLFNLQLPINFNSPYQATSLIDFWRRWHMTLSQFLRDYLYIPLGGNRNGMQSQLRNVILTMVLGGLWHGANWTFILWGLCHGIFLSINHLWRTLAIQMPNWLARSWTLLAVIGAWVVFRSPDVETAVNILKGMAGFNGVVLPEKYQTVLGFLNSYGILFGEVPDAPYNLWRLSLVLALALAVLFLPNSHYWQMQWQAKPARWGFICSCLLIASVVFLDEPTEFLYYQF